MSGYASNLCSAVGQLLYLQFSTDMFLPPSGPLFVRRAILSTGVEQHGAAVCLGLVMSHLLRAHDKDGHQLGVSMLQCCMNGAAPALSW